MNPSPTPKIVRWGPKKSKMIQQISQNQMSEFKETQKMKVVQLHKQTPKQLSNLTPTPKLAHYGPKKTKMTPKLSQIQMSEFRESQKMKVVQLHELTPKKVFKPNIEPKYSPLGSQNQVKIKCKNCCTIRVYLVTF